MYIYIGVCVRAGEQHVAVFIALDTCNLGLSGAASDNVFIHDVGHASVHPIPDSPCECEHHVSPGCVLPMWAACPQPRYESDKPGIGLSCKDSNGVGGTSVCCFSDSHLQMLFLSPYLHK